jgi:hypothetical protein
VGAYRGGDYSAGTQSIKAALLMWSSPGGSSSGLAPLVAQRLGSSTATSRRALDLSSGCLDHVSVSNVTLSNVVLSPEDRDAGKAGAPKMLNLDAFWF